MTTKIGADPIKMIGLQQDFLERSEAALKKNDGTFFLQLEKFFKLSSKKRNEIFRIEEVYESKLFQKTNTISISENPEPFTINGDAVMVFLGLIIEREAKLKNPDPSIDSDIWGYFKNKTVLGFKGFTTTVYRFLSNLNHRQILEEAENTGIKKIYTFLEGLSIIRKVILSGGVDKKGTGIIVYFKIEGNDTLCRFHAFRHDDGQLYVYVIRVNLDNEWYAGHGACFSN